MSRWITVGLLSASMGTSAPALAAEPSPSPSIEDGEHAQSPTGPGRNALVLHTHAKIPDWASGLGYQRALGQRFSVEAAVEYGYQAVGYWHLQGLSETVAGQLWLGRTFRGVFAEASMTVAHQFLARLPRLSTTAVAPGLGMGFRWTHRSGLTLGASGGLRWGRRIAASEIVCTRAKHCNSVREGAYARITADVGFVF